MKNNLHTPMAKQCRALYTKYAYGHTYGLLKVGLRNKNMFGDFWIALILINLSLKFG